VRYDDSPPVQRITITIDIDDGPGNDTTAIGALYDVVRHLEHDGIVPTFVRLEIGPTPTA
jgi:hypothetical protein